MALDDGTLQNDRWFRAARADGYQPIACRGGGMDRGTVASSYQHMTRSRHVLPYGGRDIRLMIGGCIANVNEQGVAITAMHVGIEPVYNASAAFGAGASGAAMIRKIENCLAAGISPDIAVPSTGVVVTDRVGMRVDPGGAIGIRAFLPDAGTPLSRNRLPVSGSAFGGEPSQRGTTTTPDLAFSGALTDSAGQGSVWTPHAILGRTLDGLRRSSVAIVGHSIAAGTTSVSGGGTSYDTLDSDGNSGWIERTIGVSRPFSSFTKAGDRLKYWLQDYTWKTRRFMLMNAGFSDLILQLEANDFTGAGLTVAQYTEFWRQFVDQILGVGIRVHAVTPSPISTSTDTWASADNQTGNAALADWTTYLRANAVSFGCTSVIDLAAATADPASPTKWRTDLNATLGAPPTYDGSHFSQAMTQWVASAGVFSPTTLFPELAPGL